MEPNHSTSGGPEPLLLQHGDEPKVLAVLPDELGELPDGMSRVVRISYQTYQHIVSRRAGEASWHVELVLRRMATVITNPSHIGCVHEPPRMIKLFGRTQGDDCGVYVSIKCLDNGESWVATAFPLGDKSLQKHLGADRLGAVEQQQGSLFTTF